MAAEDVLRSSDTAMAESLKVSVIAACARPGVAGVVDPPAWLQSAVRFGAPVDLFAESDVFRPVAGAPKRPTAYYPIVRDPFDLDR
jgi:hypothetical protein